MMAVLLQWQILTGAKGARALVRFFEGILCLFTEIYWIALTRHLLGVFLLFFVFENSTTPFIIIAV